MKVAKKTASGEQDLQTVKKTVEESFCDSTSVCRTAVLLKRLEETPTLWEFSFYLEII